MIGMMTTESEEVNQQNLVMLADELYERLTTQGVKAEKRQIVVFLQELKRQ